MAQIVAHDANNGLILFDADLGKFSQSLANYGDPRRVVYGQRNTDFRTGQHVHGGFRAAEKLEDAMEKSVGHEHARGADIYDVNPALAGNGFDDAGTRHRIGDDSRAGSFGPPRRRSSSRGALQARVLDRRS